MTQTAEQAVAGMIGEQFTGAASAAPAVSAPTVEPQSAGATESAKFEFDAEFQTQLATHVMRDVDFMRKVGHLVKPDYFENVGEAAIVNIAVRFWQKYGQLPNRVAAQQMLKEDLQSKVIRADMRPAVIDTFKAVFAHNPDLGNSNFFAEELARFAQHQAVTNAIYSSVERLQRKRFDEILTEIKAAVAVGVNHDGEEYNYWQRIDDRTKVRQDRASGLLPPSGITTGYAELDRLLYHKGWGKRELAALLGGAKAGKTTALINFAKTASLAGENVLYVTLEVAKEIISDRLDASVSDNLIKELGTKIHDVRSKIQALQARAGVIQIHEYPSGTFTPSMLRALIERYKSPAIMPDGSVRQPIKFGMIVVDYGDIMKPDVYTNDPIENSKQVWLGLRAIAQDEDVAMLTATQSNREGMKATIVKGTDVADDINKVRIIDLMISINITDEERANGEARLFFAASRNQESGFTVFVKQDIARMKFIVAILRVE